MSGFRCGILHSLNVGFISGLERINVSDGFKYVSMDDQGNAKYDEVVKNYIEENRKMITRSYRLVVAALK